MKRYLAFPAPFNTFLTNYSPLEMMKLGIHEGILRSYLSQSHLGSRMIATYAEQLGMEPHDIGFRDNLYKHQIPETNPLNFVITQKDRLEFFITYCQIYYKEPGYLLSSDVQLYLRKREQALIEINTRLLKGETTDAELPLIAQIMLELGWNYKIDIVR